MSKPLTDTIIDVGSAALSFITKEINNFDASAFAKRTVNSFKLNYQADEPYNNGAAMTPPMGWSSWNLFRNKINENLIYETAKAMKESGLADFGYKYINIDDCWQSSMRDENGRLQADFGSFPSGIKALSEKVNSLGLKLGIYSSNGTLTCEELPASLGNEAIDADTFAEWGIEYFKYDFCHNIPIPSAAPKIEKIIVSPVGSADFEEYGAEEAYLYGDAKIIDDDKLESGKHISGLSSNAGSCEFVDIYAEYDGEYILTLCIRKKNNGNQYAEILVNNSEIYKTFLPASKGFTAGGRHQVKINLIKGYNTIKIYNPIASRQDSAAVQYTKMGEELKRATKEYANKNNCDEKPIVYSICEWGRNFPWNWGGHAGNLWRTTPDIKPNWLSVLGIYEINVLLNKFACPGSWNDPDMLEVGNGDLTYEENKAHFTLWCMMAAPLILGNDIRKFIKPDGTVDYENPTYKIITNKELIAVDQDELGIQCKRIKTNGAEDILVKPLVNDEFAVCFLNKASTPSRMSQSLNEIIKSTFVTTPVSKKYEIHDLWCDKKITVTDGFEVDVPGHGIRIFKVRGI
ncbi:MAG: alpha-galactosidase [Acutalibacteraceae bacterium]|nr:alpha-galactosidase [Acutalibacteraceae bacterium]